MTAIAASSLPLSFTATSLTETWPGELNTWVGLCFGWAVFIILATGTLAVFERAITEWMQAPGPNYHDPAPLVKRGADNRVWVANSDQRV